MDNINFNKMTVKELQNFCKNNNIVNFTKYKKKIDLIKFILTEINQDNQSNQYTQFNQDIEINQNNQYNQDIEINQYNQNIEINQYNQDIEINQNNEDELQKALKESEKLYILNQEKILKNKQDLDYKKALTEDLKLNENENENEILDYLKKISKI